MRAIPPIPGFALCLLALAVSIHPATAGRNANGALIVHTNDAVAYTPSGSYCGAQYSNPGSCAAAGTRTDKPDDQPAVIWLLAAFLDSASPAVTTIQFGLEHNLPADAGSFAAFAPCGSGVLELPDPGWPDTGYGNTISFSGAVTTRLFPFYYFAAYGFAGAYLGTGVNPIVGHAVFADDGNPIAEDPCYNFGRVRWGQTGFNQCPTPPTCQATLTAPNGGEEWNQGSLRTITWTSSGCGGPIRIELIRGDGLVCETIASEAPNSGSYAWVAQQCLGGSADYRVRITDLRSGRSDTSDQGFSIPDTPGCQVALIAPDGGERIDQAGNTEISWGSTACGASVKIELVQNGAVCSVISPSTPNDGSFIWTAQPCAGTCGYKVRITDLGSGHLDESSEEFCFTPCAPRISAPNGGESWVAATQNEIRWDPDVCGATVRIELLRNGDLCGTIAQSTANDGSFSWTAAQCAGASDGYRIRVTDIAGGGHDESDAPFSIRACEIGVTAPNGGESWQEGTTRTITWTSSLCGSDVRIELLRNGASCAVISASTPNDGSYTWTVAQCANNTSGYAIRITDLRGGFSDVSDATFAIPDPPCALAVTAPNQGESWPEGIPRDITWSTANCGTGVRIELLLNGSVCSTISPGTPNDGVFTWTPERCGETTTGYKVRITDPSFGTSDESDVPFSIPLCAVTVSAPNGGESWIPGSNHTITWTAPLCGESVRIDLVRDGSVCSTIAAQTPNDGAFPWTAQQCAHAADGYRVRITDLATGNADESDAPFCLSCDDAFSIPSDLALTVGHAGLEIPILGVNEAAIRAYTIQVCFDAAVLQCVDMSLAGTRGEGAVTFQKSCGDGCAQAMVVFSAACPPQIEPGDGPLLTLVVDVLPDGPLGPTAITLVGGDPSGCSMTQCSGVVLGAHVESGTIEIVPEMFRRGDDNADGEVDIADPIACLEYQYAEGPAPPCLDAGDFDDSGRYDIADCVANLCRMFGACGDPPPPFEACGADPTPYDPLGCLRYPPCGNRIAARPQGEDAAGVGGLSAAPPAFTGTDTLEVAIEIAYADSLIGFQYAVDFDPIALGFLALDRTGTDFDFYSARAEAGRGRIVAGCLPDLQLVDRLAPGRRSIGRLLFAVRDPMRIEGSRLTIREVRLVGRGGIPRGGEGSEVVLPAPPDVAPDLRLRIGNPYVVDRAILLEVAEGGEARVAVYDVLGRRVRVLAEGTLHPGRHRLRWDGRTDAGTEAGTGIYYVRASVGSRRVGRKIILAR